MNAPHQSNALLVRIEYFAKTLSQFRMLLIVPTVICTVISLGYAVLKPNMWTARQSLVIRDDLVGDSFKPGRFDSQESLKSAQETILEIARKPQVIRNALKSLGHPPMMMTGRKHWPSEEVIENTQGQITIAAPNGAEFGKTEVILLSTKASSRERSRKFIELMLHEIDSKLREVRSDKIKSMSEELEQTVNAAQISFEQSANLLQEMESKFGADLSTLRNLNLQTSGDDSLQKTIIQIRSEQRIAANEVDLAKKQRELLVKALKDPRQYLVTSNELLKMLPTLDQLVTGLSTAQLELAVKSGKFTDEHTEVKGARQSIRDIKIQILKEIQASIHGLSSQIEFGEARIQKLVDTEHDFEERLSGLSSSRVEYDKLDQEVRKKSEVLNQARQALGQVQSVGQTNVNLLTRVGEPQVATAPDGPSKRAIVLAGMLGGLLMGMGLIMFAAPPYEGNDQLANQSPYSNDPNPNDASPIIPDILDVAGSSPAPIGGVPAAGATGFPNQGAPVGRSQSALSESIAGLEPILESGVESAKQKLAEGIEMIRESFAPKSPVSVSDIQETADQHVTGASETSPVFESSIDENQTTIISFGPGETEISQSKKLESLASHFEQPEESDGIQSISTSNPALVLKSLDLQTQTNPTRDHSVAKKSAGARTIVVKPVTEDPATAQQRKRKSNVRPIDLTKVVDTLTPGTPIIADEVIPVQPIQDMTPSLASTTPVEPTSAEPTSFSTEQTTRIDLSNDSEVPETPVSATRARDATIPIEELANLINREPAKTDPVIEIEVDAEQLENDDVEKSFSAEEIVRRIRARQSDASKNSRDDMSDLPSQSDVQRQPRRNPLLPPNVQDGSSDQSELEIRRRIDNENPDTPCS